eukprot:3841910-Rhodomonas_salina.4
MSVSGRGTRQGKDKKTSPMRLGLMSFAEKGETMQDLRALLAGAPSVPTRAKKPSLACRSCELRRRVWSWIGFV